MRVYTLLLLSTIIYTFSITINIDIPITNLRLIYYLISSGTKMLVG